MKHDWQEGFRIAKRKQREIKGTITKVHFWSEVEVLWDNGQSGWMETELLIPDIPGIDEAEANSAKEVQNKINEAASKLDEAFKLWTEAAEMNGGETYSLKYNPLLSTKVFEDVIEENGWSTSSLYC